MLESVAIPLVRFALSEAESCLLVAQRLPQVFESRVDLLDLGRDIGVKPVRETMPEILALLRELLDLGMDLVRCHVV